MVSSPVCPTSPSSATAGGAAAGYAVLRHWRSVLAGRADVGWPPQIENLRQLELLTEEGLDREFWQRVLDAATEELGHLCQRRYDWETAAEFGAADSAVADEVNLFLQRIFSEEPEAMVATKSKPKAKRPANTVGTLTPKPADAPAPVVASEIGEEPLGPPPAIAEFSGEIVRLPLDALDRSPYQTRREKPALWLAESLRIEKRNTEAILVRTVGLDGRHEIISGHTRVLEARRIGWTHIEGRIVECDDETARRLVFVANAKREDLSAIEQAESLQGMVDQYAAAGKSQRQLARDIGVSQAEISNLTRLLTLPEEWRQRVISGEITKSVGRMLATWTHRPKLLEALAEDLLQRRTVSRPEDLKPWTEGDAKEAITRRIQSLTESVPSPCPPEKWTELDVEKVPVWSGEANRCWNISLAKQMLRKAAAARQKQKSNAAAKRSQAPVKTGLDAYKLKSVWTDWIIRQLSQRFAGKVSKVDREVLRRVAFLTLGDDPGWGFRDKLQPKAKSADECFLRLLSMPWADLETLFIDDLLNDLREPRNCHRFYDLEIALAVARLAGVDLAQFRPDEGFLTECPEAWLKIFAAACDVDAKTPLPKLRSALIDAWAPGWIPYELAVPKVIGDDKPAKKAKGKR